MDSAGGVIERARTTGPATVSAMVRLRSGAALAAAVLLGAACGAGAVDQPPSNAVAPPPTPPPPSDDAAFALLDAVGPLAGDAYDPRPVIAAINALQPLGRDDGTALLRRYVAARGAALDERDGLFAVLRVLYEPDPSYRTTSAACTAQQQPMVDGGCLRPPRLGAPSPAPPADLRALRFPFFVLGDVPLSLVSGYALGGMPEPLGMHLDELVAAPTTWLAAPLAPQGAGEVRYLFMHYGSSVKR
jgi:hypothetical protein